MFREAKLITFQKKKVLSSTLRETDLWAVRVSYISVRENAYRFYSNDVTLRKADRETVLKTRGRKMRKNSYIVVCNEFLLCYLGPLV